MPRKSPKSVGLIGLGIIGSRVAAGLRSQGFQVYVWNRTPMAAPNFLGSPAEVAEAADLIQIFVGDSAALYSVIEAMGDALTPGHVVICNATVGPEAVIEAARYVESRGAGFVDAPFTGSKLAAEKRELVYYLGGEEEVIKRVKPLLAASSKALVPIGETGSAATIKIVTNMISAATAQTLAEALAIVQHAGLDPAVLGAAIEQNACRSGVVDLKLPKMIAGEYEPHFSVKHMLKDVQLGVSLANWLDLEVPVTTLTAGLLFGAAQKGWGDLDFSALYKAYAPAVAEQPALADAAPADEPQPPPPPARVVEEKLAKVVELPAAKGKAKPVRLPRPAGQKPLEGERIEPGEAGSRE
jgi:3-hydroxyisobutyrate dehydrogenase-like beta-hydroxyacid dehydrogenase